MEAPWVSPYADDNAVDAQVAYSVTFERCLSHCGDAEAVLLPEEHVPSRDRLGIRVSSFDLRALDVDSPLLDAPGRYM